MKFSIIVATYNAEEYLKRLLASISCQTYPHYEIFVQDGASTDGTVSILKEYLPATRWCSEKDSGVYDAWNKALDHVSGDWGIFLGADDCLMGENVLLRCRHHIKRMSRDILFAYGALAQGENGAVTKLVNRSLMDVYRRFSANMSLPFPATFVRLDLAKKYKFDASYKIAGDFDFAARFITCNNIARIPVIVSYMERGGLSTNEKTYDLMMDERGRVLEERILPKAQELIKGCIQYYRNENMTLERL